MVHNEPRGLTGWETVRRELRAEGEQRNSLPHRLIVKTFYPRLRVNFLLPTC